MQRAGLGGDGAFVHLLDQDIGTTHGYTTGYLLALVFEIVATVVFVEPGFNLPVAGGIIAEEEQLVVLGHSAQIAGFLPDKHGAEILELHRLRLTLVDAVVNAHVVAAEVDAHNGLSLGVETGEVFHHLGAEH